MLEISSPHFHRNRLPNDSAALQKLLIATWQQRNGVALSDRDLAESGFRSFSQNDEDGILLRIFSRVGQTNRHVIEIGSNCSGSAVGIPENLSANLVVHHGWQADIVEMDSQECERMRYFFAREFATRHFHWERDGVNTYYAPRIHARMVSPENIDQLLTEVAAPPEPDLLVLDIDSLDYPVMDSMRSVRPRVIVVEFEKRFRDRHSVVQFDPTTFSRNWQQSGTCSLSAWHKLLGARGYHLYAIGAAGFNAFFVRSEVAAEKLTPITVSQAFDQHPIFARIDDSFWLQPDETWREV